MQVIDDKRGLLALDADPFDFIQPRGPGPLNPISPCALADMITEFISLRWGRTKPEIGAVVANSAYIVSLQIVWNSAMEPGAQPAK